MKSTKVMHWGLSFIRLMVSSSSSGVIGAAFSTTDSRFTWTQLVHLLLSNFDIYCEAQGKGRAKGRLRKVTQRSFIDDGWWMVDILSLMLYIKFG